MNYSGSADRNKEAIGDALANYLSNAETVTEIGAGTGQHAVYFTQRFPHLHWQPTDRADNLAAIGSRLAQAENDRISDPVELDVSQAEARDLQEKLAAATLAYSANTAHIMSLDEVERMFVLLPSLLLPSGFFALYGPFQYGGIQTADSNRQFDQMLRANAVHMGVRDKHVLDRFAASSAMLPVADLPMPANNRLLLWQKSNDGS